MRHERILPDIRALFVRALRVGDLVPRPLFRFHWSGWLPWPQWLVLFTMGAAVIAFELHSHVSMWEEYHSGQTFWTDDMLRWEIILFGMVFPLLGGVGLGYLRRTADERDRMARELETRRAFVGQLQQAQSWPDLAELVVSLPGNIVSAQRAWLLAQRSGEEPFEQIAYQQGAGAGLLPLYPLVKPAVCEHCWQAAALKGVQLMTCHCPDFKSASLDCNRYCLWLSAEDPGKAALLFDLPPGRSLSKGQMRVLDDLGDEIALALGNATLHDVKQRQYDAARSERLRIARDLHDTLGQNISYLRFKLERLSDTGAAGGRAALQDELARMLLVAEEAYEQVRDTLEELRTTERRELEKMVRLYAAQVAERTEFSVHVHTSGPPLTLSTLRVRQLMYIVREALNNVEKHAGARQVDIHLHWSEREFRLTVRDDGRGFDRDEINPENHYGMDIMAERARAINANVAVTSSPGEGTELRLLLPLTGQTPDGRQRL